MTPLDAAEHAARQAARRAGDGLQDTGMRSLDLRQASRHGFRLGIVLAAIRLLERVDYGQHEAGAEMSRQPGEGAAAKAWPQASLCASAQPFAPEGGMCLLDSGEPPV